MVTGSKPKHFVDNLKMLIPEASRHFKIKRKEYLKVIFEELETNGN